jgi:hypothetical protein
MGPSQAVCTHFKLIQVLLLEQNYIELVLEQLLSGEHFPKPRDILELNEKISKLVKSFDSSVDDLSSHLEYIAKNIRISKKKAVEAENDEDDDEGSDADADENTLVSDNDDAYDEKGDDDDDE